MAMKTLWFRLGAEVDMNEETYNAVVAGDMEALATHIKQNGVNVTGNAYAPLLDDDGEYTGDDLEIGLPSIKLVQEQ